MNPEFRFFAIWIAGLRVKYYPGSPDIAGIGLKSVREHCRSASAPA